MQTIHTHTHTTIENMSILSQFFLHCFQRNSEIAKKTFMFHCLGNILLFTQCNWRQHFPVLKFKNLTLINKCNKLFNEVQILREEFKSRFQDIVGNVKHLSTHLHLHLKQKLWQPHEISNGVHTFATQRKKKLHKASQIFLCCNF